jgi:hypothetical protein
MAKAGCAPDHFSGGSNFEALRDGFFSFLHFMNRCQANACALRPSS